MQCLEGIFGIGARFTKPLEAYSTGIVDVSDPDNGISFNYFVPDSTKAKAEAASKLEGNMTMVIQDITNPASAGLKGGGLTQLHLKRVDPKFEGSVKNMVRATLSLLRGNQIQAPSKEEAVVWEQAAKFLGGRVQGSKAECPGREPDMSAAAATAMCTVLGRIEVASKLIHNREVVAKDITNPGPRGVKGGELSQTGLKRLDPKHQGTVSQMLGEVSDRLLGGGSQMTSVEALTEPGAKDKVLVWADAASFLASRIQGRDDECEVPHERRKADMSSAAASALSTTLARMEAAHRLTSNHEMVIQDITNAGPKGLKGGALTQTNLTRVDQKDKVSVQKMVVAVCCRLLDQEVSGPSTPEEAKVWVAAATFLSGRIQGSRNQCPTRQADMSVFAAASMQKVLAQIEASSKLTSNRDTVVKDICNQGSTAVLGGSVTQTDLKRLQPGQQQSVQAMVSEVCARLLGKEASGPGPSEWAEAAKYLHQRIQATSKEMPGRTRDMSVAAATAMRTVLAQL